MTNDEREKLENALAQARGAQAVLQALLTLLAKGGNRELVQKAFDLAGETFTIASLNTNNQFATEATRVLQVIDHMRQTAVGHNPPSDKV